MKLKNMKFQINKIIRKIKTSTDRVKDFYFKTKSSERRKLKKRRKKIKRLVLIKKIFMGIVCFFTFLFLAGMCFLIYAYFFVAPSVSELPEKMDRGTTIIYDRTGKHILYEIHGEENRKRISHNEIPNAIRVATIVAEDTSFYKHQGVDIQSIVRALIINLRDKKYSQGASTITQQLARNVFLTREKTVERKFMEMLIAFKIERKFDKNEILDFYLNQIPYGSNAYGIQSAAETFFGKNARDLTLDEAALLAALPKATTYYSPYGNNKDELIERQKSIIRKIGEQGIIDQAAVEKILAIDTLGKIIPSKVDIQAPHFVFYVKEILEKWYGSEELERGGYSIYTTLDYEMQKRAEDIIRQGVEKNIEFKAGNGALVAVDPRNGQLLVMVGSKDYFDKSNDGNVNVAVSLRQPGSSFKPFAYAKAFEKGYQPETMLYDVQTNFGPDGTGKEYIPNNYDGQFRGLVSMRQALAMSLNIPAVKTLYLAGIDETIDLAHRLGITTLQNRSRYGLSLVLGGGEVKLLDMVNAFSVFASNGKRFEPSAVLSVVNSEGEVIFENSPQGQQVISEQTAKKINSILSDNSARAPVFGIDNPLNFKDRKVAAKTGTTQEFRDAWTVGYTPSLAVGVWFGNNDGSFMRYGADGIYVAAPVWRKFMNGELANLPIEEFGEYEKVNSNKPLLTGYVPGKIEYYKIKSGKKISEGKLSKYDSDEVRQVLKTESHSLLFYVNRDFPLTSEKPDFNDPMLWRWEEALGHETESVFLRADPADLNLEENYEKD